MNPPLVTVFIPVYNSEKYLQESLESILNQSYTNLDILIVDDGSTDRSIEIIKNYTDRRIRLIQNLKNMGIPFTRNVGLKEAKGKYIAIMDSDDISEKNRIERQVDYLEKNANIDAVASFYTQFGGRFQKRVKARFVSPEAIKIMLLFYNPIANPSAMIRKQTLEEHQIRYKEQFFVAQDYQLWSQLTEIGSITIIPEFLLRYRFGHENITKTSNEQKKEKRDALIGKIHKDLIQFYGIDLNEDEIDTFNQFFTETYGNRELNYDRLKHVVMKLKRWNKENQRFNQQLFLQVLDYCILLAIPHHRVKLKEKLNIYTALTNQPKNAEKILLALKHAYHQIKM